MAARGVLVALASAALAAATGSRAATALPASAIFQQNLRGKGNFAPSFRDESQVTSLTALSGDGVASCTTQINAFRKTLGYDVGADYAEVGQGESPTELEKLAGLKLTCAEAASGKFSHIRSDQFVFSVPGIVGEDGSTTCSAWADQMKEGFAAFQNKLPPKYTDPKYPEEAANEGVYADPKAVAFLSVALEGSQKIYCGVPADCTASAEAKKALLCFISGTPITQGQAPFKVESWAKLLTKMGVAMPVFEPDAEKKYLNEMNKARSEAALPLDQFSEMTVESASGEEGETVDDHFKLMTCEEIKEGSIYQRSSDAHTFIYAAKDGETAPTAEEAVAFWKGGLKQLKGPLPAFSAAYQGDSTVYKQGDVVGFVSLVAEQPRKVKCQTTKACSGGPSAVVCALVGATLLDGHKPISDEAWEKLKPAEEETDVPAKPTLKALETQSDLLQLINAYRTQEALGLKEWVAQAPQNQTELLKAVTCQDLEKSIVKLADETTSLMYVTAAEAGKTPTPASALAQWKKGFAKLGKSLPPAFEQSNPVYGDPDAAAFVSLVSEKEETVSCYAASGCSREALFCELQPPALAEGNPPLQQSTWDKVVAVASTDSESSNSSSSSHPALSVLAAALALAAAAPLL